MIENRWRSLGERRNPDLSRSCNEVWGKACPLNLKAFRRRFPNPKARLSIRLWVLLLPALWRISTMRLTASWRRHRAAAVPILTTD